jgi:hypothetical protein
MVSKLKICTSDKGMITRIQEGAQRTNSPKFNNPMNKWSKDLHTAFSKEEV